MSFRTYFDVPGSDASQLGEQVARQRTRVTERLRDVRRVVAVVSGKGGVGKSYVTASLARALARTVEIGVLDADLQSPTIAYMLAARGPLRLTEDGVDPAVGADGIRVISTDLLLEDGHPFGWRTSAAEAHVWRGAMEASVLRELLGDARWGRLDTLLVDMPPDAARLVDLATLVRDKLEAVAVTLPSEESARSVQRALTTARDTGVRILGIVENMSGYACGTCSTVGPLFTGDAGERLAATFDVPLLGRLPFVPRGVPRGMLPDSLVHSLR